MQFNSLGAALALMVGILSLSQTASAYYNPALGRWMSRDPIGEPVARVHPAPLPHSQGFIPLDLGAAVPPQFAAKPSIVERAEESARLKIALRLGPSHAEDRAIWKYADGMNLYEYGSSSPLSRLDPSGLNNVTVDSSCKCNLKNIAIVPEKGAVITPPTAGSTYDADGIYINDDPQGWVWKLTDNCWGTLKCNKDSVEFDYACWPWWLGGVTKYPSNQTPFKDRPWPW